MIRQASQIFFLFAVLAFACRNAGAEFLAPGNHTVTVVHNGLERSAIVHLPSYSVNHKLSVVLNFHGGGGHAAHQQAYSMMDARADRDSFVAVYPNGTGLLGGRLLTWNAGTCCGYAATRNIDDVAFVRKLMDKLAEVAPIDRRRVYATGLSNGGMMAHRLAAEASDLIAAVAPVAGGIVAGAIKGRRAVPVMHIHSVDDPRALYAGGLGPPFPLTRTQVLHPSIDQVIARWVKHNGCGAEPVVGDRRSGAQGHTAVRLAYQNCRDGADVVLWKLSGAGHVWPGGKPKVMERLLGPSSDIIDANAQMWHFFKQYSL